MRRHLPEEVQARKGAALVWVAALLVVIFAFVAFTVDIGYMAVTKTELQNAADASAIGSITKLAFGETAVRDEAKRIAAANSAGQIPVDLLTTDVLLGRYDLGNRVFTTPSPQPNAVQVTAWRRNNPMIFSRVLGQTKRDQRATALAMLNPRDIVFVIDLSGSMNDDTEPCWATDAIHSQYSSTGYPTVAADLMQDVFDDFGYGLFPGTVLTLGSTVGIPNSKYSYAELTKDDGPLASLTVEPKYRILPSDSELVRKQKGYSFLIDKEIATIMPNADPIPDSSVNYDYWAAYIDYLVRGAHVGTEPPPDDDSDGGGGGGDDDDGASPPGPAGVPPPPAIGWMDSDEFNLLGRRQRITGLTALASTSPVAVAPPDVTPGTPRNGASTGWVWVPPKINKNQIFKFNNPSPAFAGASVPWAWRNKFGYVTYVQFMMDYGRERSPDLDNAINADLALGTKSPLSVYSPNCPRHNEDVAGNTLSFPPRAQPMHALRRALISGIDLVKQRNNGLSAGDRISIVTFDARDTYHHPTVVVPLTSNYDAVMQSCTDLQASADIGATTSTESGVILARQHLETKTAANNPTNVPAGPQGRSFASKVIILLTDGLPNTWESNSAHIKNYINKNPDADFYGEGYDWFNSVLVQTSGFLTSDKGQLFPVGMGIGTDYDFMDRIARIAASDDAGSSPRSTGNPAQYEAQLLNILSTIIKNPGGRLME